MLARSLRIALLWLVACAGCAQEVEDIDRTQANRIRKSVFEGEWYLARTVIDAPYTTSFTFIGEAAELERVRWEIQSDMLIAYRVYDRVEGTDEKAATVTASEYQGAPIVAYPIVKHFDITRQYNPATGEQSNVLEENETDRPWYDRELMRVDWSQNLLPSLTFLVDFYASTSSGAYVVETPMAYHVEDPEHPHHMVAGVRNADGSWTDHRSDAAISALHSAEYLETTTRVAVEPTYMEVLDWYDNVLRDPQCWYYANADCEHQNILVRTSFLKVPESSSYVPLHYPDNEVARDEDGKALNVLRDEHGDVVRDDAAGAPLRLPMFDKFGYFRVERHGYDPLYGELESNRTYLCNRWNIWDQNGEPKPIVYHLSAAFPEHLKEAAQKVADSWDAVFKKAVEVTGKTPPARMFELRENTGQRMGDMRWSFLYYVHDPTMEGLLGYGPSLVDPITGEILGATANVYGAHLLNYSAWGRQIVDLLNGKLSAQDIAMGRDVQALVDQMKTIPPGATGTEDGALTMEDLQAFVKERVESPRGKAIRKAGKKKLRRSSGWFQAQLSKVAGSAFEQLLVNDEVKLLKGRKIFGPGDAVPDPFMKSVSPVGWVSEQQRQTRHKRLMRLAKRNMYMSDFVDDAVAGLAMDLKDDPPEDTLRYIEERVFRSTAEHELGHTFGLRHNFAGSYDALNFPKEYWDQRGATAEFPPKAKTPKQIAGRMDEHRYSSIMEYAARFNADIQGLGHYDEAAIVFAYSGYVQVFEHAPADPLATWTAVGAGDDAVPTEMAYETDLRFLLHDVRHYTSLPGSLGSVDAMYERRYVPYAELHKQLRGETEWKLWEVPYRFCSDEYDGALDWCAVYDAGMDPYEVVADAASRYHNYYFFRAFKRDQAGWDGWDYDSTIWYRYFRFMQNVYQTWAFFAYDWTQIWAQWQEDGAPGIQAEAWDLARDGGAALTAGAKKALELLVQVLAIPRPGGYAYDKDLDRYWRWTPDPYEWPTCGPDLKEKDDPTAPCLDLNVELGDGRYAFTQYDPADGYYFYERPLWVGAFIDKVLALEALADPTVTFLGVETGEDVDGYALNFFLYFPDILSRLSGGIIADDVNQFAGFTQYGDYVPPDPFGAKPDGATIVDPDTWSTVQYYAMWLAMAGYSATFDNTFNDLIHIWYDGSGQGQTVPDPSAESVATWYDPTTQRTYRAVRHPDPKLYSVGYEMVKRAAALQSRLESPLPGDDPEYTKIQLGWQRELIDLAIGMWELYGKLVF